MIGSSHRLERDVPKEKYICRCGCTLGIRGYHANGEKDYCDCIKGTDAMIRAGKFDIQTSVKPLGEVLAVFSFYP